MAEFSNITSKAGLLQRAEDFSLLGDGGITNDATLKAKFTNWINEGNGIVQLAIMRADKYWKFDDANFSNFPIATIDLVSGQRDYTLPASTVSGNPSTLYRVNRFRVKDTSANWQVLYLLAPTEEESVESGMPTKYRLLGNSVRLSDIPLAGSVTLTGGLEVQFQRGPDQFVVGDTTQQPSFIDTYHYLLPLYASAQYFMPSDMNRAQQYLAKFSTDLLACVADSARRNGEILSRLGTVEQNNE